MSERTNISKANIYLPSEDSFSAAKKLIFVSHTLYQYLQPQRKCTLFTENILMMLICFAVHSLPHLTVLSLSGCSKITDDGVELIAENLQKLRALDLSWCPRITDAALEYIACDLNMLEELTLDRFDQQINLNLHSFHNFFLLSDAFI